jgi:hypothetical protein
MENSGMEKTSFVGRPQGSQRPALPSHTEPSVVELLTTSAAVLPEQFYNPPARTTGRGEVALMRAVLEEAVDCFQKQFVKSGRRAQRLAREAEEWIYSDEVRWPFSFVNICAVLGLDPDYVRLKLKRWREQAIVEERGDSCIDSWGHSQEIAFQAAS